MPVTAVAHDGQGDFAFVLTPGEGEKQAIVKKTYVEVKEIVQQGVRVTSGLNNGDRIVTAGVTIIRDGMAVKVE